MIEQEAQEDFCRYFMDFLGHKKTFAKGLRDSLGGGAHRQTQDPSNKEKTKSAIMRILIEAPIMMCTKRTRAQTPLLLAVS